MKYLKIITLFSLLVFFSSCEDFFDQTTKIDIPPHVPKLGVTALWLDEGNDQLVMVFASVGALEDESSSAVSDATVTLAENGTQIATLVEDNATKGFYRPSVPVELVAGQTYELTVSAPNFETVKAEQVMPSKPTIKKAQFVNSVANSNNNGNGKLHLTISDDDGRDFYLIGVESIDTSESYSSIYSSSGIAEDSGLDYSRVILKDETFPGADLSQTFDAYISSSTGTVDSVKVNLWSVTADYYRFDRTYNAVQNADDNPFAEPVIMHRNFEKGFGVFALGNKRSMVIPVE